MAKKPAPKLKKKRQVKKPQKLPVSVQALLKYLGGSNVAIAGSGPSNAVIAPQFPMPQPQQQQAAPQQQAQPRRRKTGNTVVIASSPLAQLAPPPPPPPQPQKIDEEKLAKETVRQQAKEKERKLATSRVEKLEGQIGGFTQEANLIVGRFRSLEKTVKQLSYGDENILDNRLPAGSIPQLDEPQLNVDVVKAPIVRAASVPNTRMIELDPDQAMAQQQSYLSSVTNPQLSPQVKLKGKAGRKPLSEAEKEQRKIARKSAGEIFLQEGASTMASMETLTASLAPRGKTPKTPRTKSTVSLEKLQGLDPSTQIQQIAGGGVAQPSQRQGISIVDLLQGKMK
jgi:hypothetical protein